MKIKEILRNFFFEEDFRLVEPPQTIDGGDYWFELINKEKPETKAVSLYNELFELDEDEWRIIKHRV